MQPLNSEDGTTFHFGGFELNAIRRILQRDGKIIPLKPKVFETLLVLVRNSGRVMDKDELMQQVWPDTVVEEVNLAHNISVLRKALGQSSDENRFIVTVPGKGYGFVAEVTAPRPAPFAYELTRSRLVVEEESEETAMLPPPEADLDRAAILRSRFSRNPARRNAIVAAALAAFAIVIAVSLLISNSRQQPRPAAQIKSIAVLPFKPLVAESRDEPLELGMADTLITRLGNIREINVRPVSAVRKYAGLEQDAVDAGLEQKVDAVLDGQIQKSGDKIRVTVRLVSVGNGSTLWSGSFDDKITDIFTVEDSISDRVVGVLAVKLTSEERTLVVAHGTDDTEAYQLYLKGRYFWDKRTGDAIRRGVGYFDQAIKLDPRYALAFTALADCYVLLSNYSDMAPKEAYSNARAAATAALKIDDNMAEAHADLAYIKSGYDWDFAEAEKEYKRSIELNPNYATARHWYGEFLGLMGRRDESIAELRRARELEPLSLVINTELGTVLYFAGLTDQSIEQLRNTVDLDSSFRQAHVELGFAYRKKGQYQEALSEFKTAEELDPKDAYAVSQLAHTLAVLGRRDEAYKTIAQLKERSEQTHVSPSDIAGIYAALGEKEPAFEWLEKAIADRDENLLYLKVDPSWDSLRPDPRFAVVLRRIGLPE